MPCPGWYSFAALLNRKFPPLSRTLLYRRSGSCRKLRNSLLRRCALPPSPNATSIPNSKVSFKSPQYFHTLWLNPKPPTFRVWKAANASRLRSLYCAASSFVSREVRIMELRKASLFRVAAVHSSCVPVLITASTFLANRVTIPCACRRVAGKSSKLKTASSRRVMRPAAWAISSQAVL